MAKFLVVYDLRNPGKDYRNLHVALESLPHFHAQQSLWFVQWSGTAPALRDKLALHIDNNDILFVAQLDMWASFNMPAAGNWLNSGS